MTDLDQTQFLDIARIRAGLKAARRWTVYSSLPWIAFLLPRAFEPPSGLGWIFRLLPLAVAAFIAGEMRARRLDSKRLAGPRGILIDHYRKVLSPILAYGKAHLAIAATLVVTGSLGVVLGHLPGLILLLGALAALVLQVRVLGVLQEHTPLPPAEDPGQD
jgi:hypothetical protein